MADDSVAKYCESLGFSAKPRTVLVEGETDVNLFCRCKGRLSALIGRFSSPLRGAPATKEDLHDYERNPA